MCTCGRKLCGGYFLDSLQIEGIPCRPLLAGGNYIDDRWSGNVSVIPRFLSDQTYVYKYVLFLKPKQMLVSFEVNPSSMLPGNSELWVQPEWKGTFRSSTFNILITRWKHMIGHETRMVRSVVCEPPSRWSAIRGQSRSVDLPRSFFSFNEVE